MMIKQWFQAFLRWSEPFPSVRDGAQRSRAQTLAAICILSLGILMPLTFIGPLVNNTLTISTFFLRSVIVVGLLLVYLLARRGKNELGARVIVLLLWGLLFGVALSGNATIPGALRTLDLLILVPLLTSVIMPQREAVIIWVMQQLLLLGVPIIRPTLDAVTSFSGPFLFNFVIGGSILTIIALYQRNERKLRDQIERKGREQDALMNNLPDFVLRIDPQFRYLYVNAPVQAAFASPLDDIIGRHVMEVPPDPPPSVRVNRLAWLENAQAAIDSKQTIRITLSQSPLEDVPFWFDLTFVPEIDASGRVESVLVVGRNITEQKRLADEIERKGRELATLMNNLPDNVTRVDTQFRYLYANAVALNATGMTLADIVGKVVTDLPVNSPQHQVNRSLWVETAQQAIEQKQAQQMNWFWDRLNGHPYWLDLVFVPELDAAGRVESVLVVGRDVTEQKIVEEALERERAFIRKIMDTAPLMIYVYDRRIEGAARMAFANPALERFYGVPSGDWSRLKTPQFLEVVHPDDLPRWVSYLASVIAADSDPVRTLELRLRRADGEYRWLRYWLTVFDDQPSRQHGQVLGIVADITDEKALQAAMLESERKRAELQAAQSLNILKTQMMIRVADQFRNPLAAVLTATDMLDNYSARMTDEARQTRFVQIRDQVARLTKLLDDMHSVLYTSERELLTAQDDINLEVLCQGLLENCAYQFNNTHIFKLEAHGDCQAVNADPSAIRAILNPLLHNAFLYTPPDGTITLEIAAAERIMLRVRDTGIGITHDDSERVFEAFYRGSNIDERPGLGLGLSIVRETVLAQQGTIEFKSEAGQGAIFTVWLPYPPERPKPQAAAAAPHLPTAPI